MSTNLQELQKKIQLRQAQKTEEEILQEDEYILMAGYLSEIEKFQKQNKVNRKDLAAKIKTSASYLTQVFRGDKPLNFYTIAKIQKALKIRFKVITIPLNQDHSYISGSLPIRQNFDGYITSTLSFDVNQNGSRGLSMAFSKKQGAKEANLYSA